MSFYKPDLSMKAQLAQCLDYLESKSRARISKTIAITWVRYKAYPEAGAGRGVGWRQNRLFYPASIISLVYAIAIEEWLRRDWLPDSHELRRALHDMVVESNNDATGFIVDLLTGTTSGPSLQGVAWQSWKEQRQMINRWLQSLGWKELEYVSCCQKIWGDGPYGREYDFHRAGYVGQYNALTTAAVAVMFEAVMSDTIVSPLACSRLRRLLLRSLRPELCHWNLENQIDGFLGAGIALGSRFWGKSDWTNQVRHDAVCWQTIDGGPTTLLVVFSNGKERSVDGALLPTLATALQSLEVS